MSEDVSPTTDPMQGVQAEPRLLAGAPRGRVLCFAPHPDDEAIGPGGALALHARQGDAVRVVIATDGRSGDPDRRHAPEHYAALRRTESTNGLRALGVTDVTFWGFPDNQSYSATDLELATRMAAEVIRAHAADVVYLPWEREGHGDHHVLHLAVVKAMEMVGYRGRAFGYEVWNAMVPDVLLDITTVVEQKRAAMKCHASQLAYVDYEHVILGLNAYRSLVHGAGKGWAEAFRVLRG
ncbi:MAG: hypothetical protein RL148_494 [Planctomycetota bacterium]